MKKIQEYFEEVETTKEYDGYYYQIGDIISIVVLGSLILSISVDTYNSKA